MGLICINRQDQVLGANREASFSLAFARLAQGLSVALVLFGHQVLQFWDRHWRTGDLKGTRPKRKEGSIHTRNAPSQTQSTAVPPLIHFLSQQSSNGTVGSWRTHPLLSDKLDALNYSADDNQCLAPSKRLGLNDQVDPKGGSLQEVVVQNGF